MSVGERTAASPARFLGDGTIKLVYKRYMFAEDKNVGKVYVPMEAAFPKYSNCNDLRLKFHVDDEVAFTAVRTSNNKNNPFSACSIVHKKDLIVVTGKVMELCEKYAYVDAPRIGRIFAPFSARTDSGRPWHGKSAEVGRNIVMKVLPQPEFQKCGHVAFAICDKNIPAAVTTASNANAMSADSKAERQPDNVLDQLGIVVELPTKEFDGLIYSQTTGAIALPKKVIHVEFVVGTFVYFNADKAVSDHHDKCVWRATHIEIVGRFSFLESDYLLNRFVNTNTESCLTVETYALVCRVSESNASAWLWNDLLGRIFVNNHHFITDMHAMDVVQVKAQYTAAFEDVPWSAINVRRVHEGQSELRAKYGQLLKADDDWHVNHVCEQCNGGFYGFLEHKVHGAAFMAWTDLNQGERPPTKGSTVRVTGYIQLRDRKHPWRALLVTPYDSSGNLMFDHPIHKTTGEFHPEIKAAIDSMRAKNPPPPLALPAPISLPSPAAPPAAVIIPKPSTPVPKAATTPSQPPPPAWNGAAKQTSSSTTSIDSGRASITSIAAVNSDISTGTAPGTPLTVSTPGVIDGPPPGFGSPARSVLSSGRNSVTPIGSERAVNLQQNGASSPPAPPTVYENGSNGSTIKASTTPKSQFENLFPSESNLGLFGPWRDNSKNTANGTKAWPNSFADTKESPVSTTPVNGLSSYSTLSSDTNTNTVSSTFSHSTTIFDELLTLRAPLQADPVVPSRDFLVLDTSQPPPPPKPAPIAPPRNSKSKMKAPGEPSSEAVAIANMLRNRKGSDTEYENFLYEQVVQRPHLVVRILRTPDAMLLADALKTMDENDGDS
uniref:SET domain-containing protein n=1 Tax=Panagrellus redivivus TaxID=6233 RepID=A0A7E4VX24_PANRE